MDQPTERMKLSVGIPATYPWIEIRRLPERKERHFAGKVHAFNAGYERVKAIDFDVVGNLDADVSFERDHFEFLLTRMAENNRLGLAGASRKQFSVRLSIYKYRECLGGLSAIPPRML